MCVYRVMESCRAYGWGTHGQHSTERLPREASRHGCFGVLCFRGVAAGGRNLHSGMALRTLADRFAMARAGTPPWGLP